MKQGNLSSLERPKSVESEGEGEPVDLNGYIGEIRRSKVIN
jgi:hypothetical protein